jgi:hypothetical protein
MGYSDAELFVHGWPTIGPTRMMRDGSTLAPAAYGDTAVRIRQAIIDAQLLLRPNGRTRDFTALTDAEIQGVLAKLELILEYYHGDSILTGAWVPDDLGDAIGAVWDQQITRARRDRMRPFTTA